MKAKEDGQALAQPDGQDRDWWIVAAGLSALLGAIVAYAIKFGLVQALPFGGPGEWGEFGDYVGGLVNPVIGLATVILVVRTLKVTRTEAADTRRELSKQTGHLESQVKHFERREMLDEMRKRLDGALSDWNLALEVPFAGINRLHPDGELYSWKNVGNTTTRMFLYRPDILGELKKHAGKDALSQLRPDWGPKFAHLIQLLEEMELYCLEYDSASGDKRVSNFYRHRIQVPLNVFRAADIIGKADLLSLAVPVTQRIYQ